MNPKYKPLFDTFTLPSGVTLKNRITMAPMTNFASHENGEVSDQELAYYRERSGGVGAVITACVYVTPDGKGFVNEFGADKDEMIPSLRRLVRHDSSGGRKSDSANLSWRSFVPTGSNTGRTVDQRKRGC